MACRQTERAAWLDEFEAQEGWIEIGPTASQRAAGRDRPGVRVRKVESGDETLVFCVSDGRSAKDRAIREKHERRLLEDLSRLAARIAAGRIKDRAKIQQALGRLRERHSRVARYWDIEYDPEAAKLSWTENAERKERAAQLDGAYLLRTNREGLDADDIWCIYSMLTRAESAFRAMKSPLAERPIFHQLEHRVRAHIFLCVLAYHLLVAIERSLRDRGIHSSWATVRDALSTHYILTVLLPTTDGHILRIRKASTPEPEVRRLYDALNIPHQPIKPIKTWSKQRAI